MSIISVIFALVFFCATMKKIILFIAAAMMLSGCVTQTSQQATGTIVGMQVGSAVGRVVGLTTGTSWRSVGTATAIGTVAGAMIGNRINAPKKSSAERSKTVDIDTTTKSGKKEKRRAQIEQAVAEAAAQSDVKVGNVLLHTGGGDNTLREDEYAKLSFDITNASQRTIATVDPLVLCSNRNIGISPMERVENLLPGEVVRYTVTLSAERLRRGTASLIIKLSVDGGEYRVIHIEKIKTEK